MTSSARGRRAGRTTSNVNDVLARSQLVLRQGRSVVDLGVFYDGVPNPALTDPQHFLGTGSATSSAGYTYDYLAPAFLSNATTAGGGYTAGAATGKALILNNQATMRVADAQRLVELAKQGLRIFVVGDAPSRDPRRRARRRPARRCHRRVARPALGHPRGRREPACRPLWRPRASVRP